MKKHITNAAFGALDYAVYPIGMLAIAPVVLHKLGAAEYGLWMVATSVVSAGGIMAAGFSDAGMQQIAILRGAGLRVKVTETIRALFAINFVLGWFAAMLVWIGAPYAARHIADSHVVAVNECIVSLRIGSAIIFMRALEAVSVTVQRAFEEYRETVQINVVSRLLTLASAAVLSVFSMRVDRIMLATAAIFAVSTWLQFRSAEKLLGAISWRPAFHVPEMRSLLSAGVFVWLQTAGSVVFRQLDRILLGVAMGAAAVAPYAICVQISEPLFGLTASGLSFFFPYLSSRISVASRPVLRHSVWTAFACNLFLVVMGTALLFLCGGWFLRTWAGPAVAQRAHVIFPWIVCASACTGLSVTGTYALQALGHFRTAASISLGSRSVILLLMLYLLHTRGLQGLAITRLCYGVATLLVYVPLMRALGWSTQYKAKRTRTAVDTNLQKGACL